MCIDMGFEDRWGGGGGPAGGPVAAPLVAFKGGQQPSSHEGPEQPRN